RTVATAPRGRVAASGRLGGTPGRGNGLCTRPGCRRLAYLDSQQAGTHNRVNPVDVWTDYAQRIVEGWAPQQIVDALQVAKSKVSKRLSYHKLPEQIQRQYSDNVIDEGHFEPILAIVPTSELSGLAHNRPGPRRASRRSPGQAPRFLRRHQAVGQ